MHAPVTNHWAINKLKNFLVLLERMCCQIKTPMMKILLKRMALKILFRFPQKSNSIIECKKNNSSFPQVYSTRDEIQSWKMMHQKNFGSSKNNLKPTIRNMLPKRMIGLIQVLLNKF